ncbi:MAG: AAA family ATPase [Coriobacteriia bacterium]|jgi:uncharacterized protein YhaN|nr:AAA family ATPase [Coriobacteriia bacterium]
MRLRRVEATRFGSLREVTLGPLGDGLTVVLGPNEAGKSTFTALVRYLLYGFPTEASRADRPYLSDAGSREGRLVYESAEGEWVIERMSGPRGGPSAVRALEGPERLSLIEEITAGVSEQAFKVVFGFGLAEMAEIERLRGTDDDIVARLYAAGAGLRVSPQEVRAAIEAEADELYRPRATTRVINGLIAQTREMRTDIGTLERKADELAADRERLSALQATLNEARRVFDAAIVRHRSLAEEHRSLADLEDALRAGEEGLLGLRLKARDARAAFESVIVDDAVLAASADISHLTEELSAFRQRREVARELEGRIASLASERAARLVEASMTEDAAAAIDMTPETWAGVERWRDELRTAEQRAHDAIRDRDEAAEEARVAAAAMAGAGPGTPAARVATWPLAWVALVAGAVLGGVAVWQSQWIAALAGLLLIGFAAAQLLRGDASRSPDSDTARAAERVADLQQRAEKLALSAERTQAIETETRADWLAWLEARGLSGLTEPTAVIRVLDLVADARRLDDSRRQDAERLERERGDIDAFIARVAAACRALDLPLPQTPHESDVAVVRLKERLVQALAAAAESDSAEREVSVAEAAVADVEARQAHAETRAMAIIERLGLSGGLVELTAAVEQAERAHEEARDHWESLHGEEAALRERIGERERERTMGSLRLELASTNERIAKHAERYAELTLASGLLKRAQERYEQERQPEVVREAQRIFATITGGAYSRLTMPLGSSDIEVFDHSSRAKHTGLLSTGTADQLYLALRLALIGQLGETGAALPVLMDDVFANFDPARKAGAADAVAELAKARQVVVFTCHPETAALFEAAEPGLTSLILGDASP